MRIINENAIKPMRHTSRRRRRIEIRLFLGSIKSSAGKESQLFLAKKSRMIPVRESLIVALLDLMLLWCNGTSEARKAPGFAPILRICSAALQCMLRRTLYPQFSQVLTNSCAETNSPEPYHNFTNLRSRFRTDPSISPSMAPHFLDGGIPVVLFL